MSDIEKLEYPRIEESDRKKLVDLQKRKHLAIAKTNLLSAEFEYAAATAVSGLDVPMESAQLCLVCGTVRPQGIDCPRCSD